MLKLCVSLVGFILMTNLAQAGESGGGGDNLKPETGAAWFLDDSKTVSYCVQVSDKFGPSEKAVKDEIANVFKKWKEYIVAKKIGTDVSPYTWPTDHRLTINSRLVNCSEKHDLTFFMGVENRNTKKIKNRFDNPDAFVFETSYDRTSGWGEGFVWFANSGTVFPKENYPNWKKPEDLHAMLLHEIGHIFGNPHVSDTIMDEDISAHLRENTGNFNLQQIDGNRILALCHSCDESYSNGYLDSEAFKFLMGRDPVGTLKASFFRSYVGSDSYGRITFTISDSQKSGTFTLSLNERGGAMASAKSVGVFNTYRERGAMSLSYYESSLFVFGSVSFGSQKIPAVFESNNTGFAEIYLIKPNGERTLAFTVTKYFR